MKKLLLGILTALFLLNPAVADNSTSNLSKETQNNSKQELKTILKEANSYVVNNHEKSIELYKQALKIDPASDEAYYNIGSMYLWDGKPEESLDYFINTIKYNPKHVLAYSAIAANCDALGYYDLTSEYVAKYRKEFPNDKINNDLADKFAQTSKAKQEFSQRMVSFIKPPVTIDLYAPKWVPSYKSDTAQMQFFQLIHKGTQIDTSPEALTFTELKGIGSRFITSNDFANQYSASLKNRKGYDFKYKIVESNGKYTIFETSFPGQYDIFKCVLGKSSVYMLNYTLKPDNISEAKKKYWLDIIKKANFTEIN